jgi:hypothetical protein
VCCNFEGSVVVMLGDLEGRMMGTLQRGRPEGVNVDIFPINSKTFGLISAVFGKGIVFIRGRYTTKVASTLQYKLNLRI